MPSWATNSSFAANAPIKPFPDAAGNRIFKQLAFLFGIQPGEFSGFLLFRSDGMLDFRNFCRIINREAFFLGKGVDNEEKD